MYKDTADMSNIEDISIYSREDTLHRLDDRMEDRINLWLEKKGIWPDSPSSQKREFFNAKRMKVHSKLESMRTLSQRNSEVRGDDLLQFNCLVGSRILDFTSPIGNMISLREDVKDIEPSQRLESTQIAEYQSLFLKEPCLKASVSENQKSSLLFRRGFLVLDLLDEDRITKRIHKSEKIVTSKTMEINACAPVMYSLKEISGERSPLNEYTGSTIDLARKTVVSFPKLNSNMMDQINPCLDTEEPPTPLRKTKRKAK